jgi:hypothetical protein
MVGLGEVLAALHGPEPRFDSVQATLVSCSHRERMMDAFRSAADEHAQVWTAYAPLPAEQEPSPVEDERTLCVTHQQPDRWRIAREGADDWENTLAVYSGEHWWTFSKRE